MIVLNGKMMNTILINPVLLYTIFISHREKLRLLCSSLPKVQQNVKTLRKDISSMRDVILKESGSFKVECEKINQTLHQRSATCLAGISIITTNFKMYIIIIMFI